MDKPLISVILPTYNGAEYLDETLKSVLRQSYDNLEIIITDDCSTDNTVAIVKSYDDKRIMLYENEQNLGIAGNTNKALSLATGDYILMQDQDDISLPNRAEVMLSALEDNKEITGCGSSFMKIGKDDKVLSDYDRRGYIIAEDSDDIKTVEPFESLIPHQTMMYRRSILNKLDNMYDSSLKVGADLDFIEKLNASGARWLKLENTLLAYRVHGMNTTLKYPIEKYSNSLRTSVKTIKRFLPNESDNFHLLHAKIVTRREILRGEDENIIYWVNKMINMNKDNIHIKKDRWLKIVSKNFCSALILSNISNPIRAYNIYKSINELEGSRRNFLEFMKEWQKRFIRNVGWKTTGNKSIKRV